MFFTHFVKRGFRGVFTDLVAFHYGLCNSNKTFILDIRVLMNDDSIINLEMQVINQQNWVERSMSYLCRCFDNIPKGEDYINVKPVVQIGLLDYALCPGCPEFYAAY